jgi:hypothetical protein
MEKENGNLRCDSTAVRIMGAATLTETVQARCGNHAYVEAEGTENLYIFYIYIYILASCEVGVVGWVRVINEN